MPSSIIPAYNYPSPTTVWDGWITGSKVVRWMIADPGSPSGPGTFTDTNYQAAITHAQANSIGILGYVDTNFAAVSTATAKAQVDAWFTYYAIRDIFFDNAASSSASLAYYQTLSAYVRASGGKVMLNFGTNPAEAYYSSGVADILGVFEGSQTDFNAFVPAKFIPKYPGNMTAVLVYDVPTSGQMIADAKRAYGFGAGYIYITDDTLASFPWDTVPSYWSAEIAALTDAPGGGGLGG